jgi:quinol monooxygenase YgiN
MINAFLRIKVLPEKKKAVIDILQSIQSRWQLKHEWLLCKIYEEHDEDEILYLEQWLTKEALYRHIQSDLYLRILEVMELAAASPQISFQFVSEVQGMDLVIELRKRVS